jgi:hypothetical protein
MLCLLSQAEKRIWPKPDEPSRNMHGRSGLGLRKPSGLGVASEKLPILIKEIDVLKET